MIKIIMKSNLELEEGRIEDMKKKYPGKDDLVDQFSKAPGNNKYLDWMMKHHEEDSPENILKAIQKFDRVQSGLDGSKKDINSYSSFDDLLDTLSDVRPPKKELEREGTQKIFEDEEFSIYRPLNKEASCKIGVGSKWCIAATKSRNYFDEYAESGAVHYILKIKKLPNNNPTHMVAYTFVTTHTNPSPEIYDAEDTLIDRSNVIDAIEEADREPTPPTPSVGDSKFLDYGIGPGDDDFENDYAEVQNSADSAKQKEHKLYRIMIEDFMKKIPSKSSGEDIKHYYDIINNTTREYNEFIKDNEINLADPDNYFTRMLWFIPEKIRAIFVRSDNNLRDDPEFVQEQFRKLINLNNPFVDQYFKDALEKPPVRGDRIGQLIRTELPDRLKAKLEPRFKKLEDEKLKREERKTNLIIEDIFSSSRMKRTVEILHKQYKEQKVSFDKCVTQIHSFYEAYSIREIQKVVKIIFDKLDSETSQTNESKLFSFNKDKKMFKLLR